MVIVARQQRGAGRTAQRRRVEAVVTQTAGSQLLQRRHLNGPAKGAAVAEADVVDQHDHDVGNALRRLHFEARRRLGVARVEQRDRLELRLRDRQHTAIDLGRRWHLRLRARLLSYERERNEEGHAESAECGEDGDMRSSRSHRGTSRAAIRGESGLRTNVGERGAG